MTERSSEGDIVVERRGPVLLMGTDRIEKRNGFTPKMFRELGEAYTLLERDPDLAIYMVRLSKAVTKIVRSGVMVAVLFLRLQLTGLRPFFIPSQEQATELIL
jgi:hypothetical protein